MTGWCANNCESLMYISKYKLWMCYTNKYTITSMPLFNHEGLIVIFVLINYYMVWVYTMDHVSLLM